MLKKRRRHSTRRYRSGLENDVAAYLKKHQKKVRYERLKIEWEDLRYRTYTKGICDVEDRRKHLAVRRQHPELDIRFVFSNCKAKLYKGSKTRYCDWCDKYDFKWEHRIIPEDWLKEKGELITVKTILFKGKKKVAI